MRITIRKFNGETVERKLEKGQQVRGLRITTLSIESPEEVRYLITNPQWAQHVCHAFVYKPPENVDDS